MIGAQCAPYINCPSPITAAGPPRSRTGFRNACRFFLRLNYYKKISLSRQNLNLQ
jgi:hypothetical protein